MMLEHVIVGLGRVQKIVLPVLKLGLEATQAWEQRDMLWLRRTTGRQNIR